MKQRRNLERVIDNYSALLWSVSAGILKDYAGRADIEDIISDVFLELYEHPDHFDEARGSLKTWLCMRVRSKSLDWLKKACRNDLSFSQAAYDPDTDLNDIPILLDSRNDPALLVLEKDTIGKVTDCIDRLESPVKEISRLRFLYEVSPMEIASLLEISIRRVYVLIRKGREQLRKELKGELDE